MFHSILVSLLTLAQHAVFIISLAVETRYNFRVHFIPAMYSSFIVVNEQ